ncbi:MAG: hypothetical protein EBS70_06405, partial [Actinobacteria bacterium]|nr:hypothetical protein [Actinomycetota bacterium]
VEGKETGPQPRVSDIYAKVALLVPFLYNGKELLAEGEFEQQMTNSEGWIVHNFKDIEPVIQQARMKALLGAAAMLDGSVRSLMKEQRPSVSLKKQIKKSDALIKRIERTAKVGKRLAAERVDA